VRSTSAPLRTATYRSALPTPLHLQLSQTLSKIRKHLIQCGNIVPYLLDKRNILSQNKTSIFSLSKWAAHLCILSRQCSSSSIGTAVHHKPWPLLILPSTNTDSGNFTSNSYSPPSDLLAHRIKLGKGRNGPYSSSFILQSYPSYLNFTL
jgi:hypothetical protein